MSVATAVSMSASGARKKRWILLAGRLGLAGIFIFAAIAKLRQPWQLFTMTIDSYQMNLPIGTVNFMARVLPWFELALGAALLLGWQLRWFATLSTLVLAAFFGVMLRAYFKGLVIDCGCFGPGEHLGPKTLLRDGSLFVASALVLWGAFRAARARS